jgi:hypothetical protein
MLGLNPRSASRNLSVAGRPKRSEVQHLGTSLEVPVYEAEFWTSRQRQASPIHEISYRACFKPQLPAYFIGRLTDEGDVVYDPFSGRGTTAVEAALHGRNVIANDVNPLSAILTYPRLELPSVTEIDARLRSLRFAARPKSGIDLSMFFHPDTEYEILGLREYLYRRAQPGPRTPPTAGYGWWRPTGSRDIRRVFSPSTPCPPTRRSRRTNRSGSTRGCGRSRLPRHPHAHPEENHAAAGRLWRRSGGGCERRRKRRCSSPGMRVRRQPSLPAACNSP